MTDPERNEAMREAAREALRELLPELLGELRTAGTDHDANGHTHGHHNRNGYGHTNGHAHGPGPGHAHSAAPGHAHGSAQAHAHSPGHAHPSAEARHSGPDADLVALVPAPPVAAVLRPSTWAAPPAPGEVIGDGKRPADAVPPSQPNATAPAGDTGGAELVTLDSDADLQRFVATLLRRFENPRERRELRAGRIRFALRRSAAAGAGAATARSAPAMHVEKGAVTERMVREAAAAGARLVLARRAVLTPLARDQARALRVTIEREEK